MQILVVEDDPILNHHLTVQLTEKANQVRGATTASEALYLANNYTLDVGIIDLGLPDQDGVSLIRELRAKGQRFPILILTARANWQDKVEGLEAGADDYLVKPFAMPELVARLHALTRRHSGFVQSQVEFGSLSVDLLSKQAKVNDEILKLTAFEYQILEYLLRNQNQVISKQRLLDMLYSEDQGDTNTVEVIISRLRRKLINAMGYQPIITIRGQGYRLEPPCD